MTRTFTVLATLVGLALVATIVFGFWSWSLDKRTEFYKDIFVIHFILGLTTSLAVLFVHCIIFTYFLGTGRWVKEVGLAYGLPDVPLLKQTRELKRYTFPPALFAMLTTIATAASGAGAQLHLWHWHIHATLAGVTLVINLWAFRSELRNVRRNSQIIEAVLVEVDRIRQQHGLPRNEEALHDDLAVAKGSTQR